MHLGRPDPEESVEGLTSLFGFTLHAKKEVLRADVVVAEGQRLPEGQFEGLFTLGTERDFVQLAGGRLPFDAVGHPLAQGGGVDTGLGHGYGCHPFALFQRPARGARAQFADGSCRGRCPGPRR